MYNAMYYGGIALSIFFFILAIVFFFTQDIPGVIDYYLKMKGKTLSPRRKQRSPQLTDNQRRMAQKSMKKLTDGATQARSTKNVSEMPGPAASAPKPAQASQRPPQVRQVPEPVRQVALQAPQQPRGQARESEDEYIDYLVAQKFERISREERKQLKNAVRFATALLDADYTQALPDIDDE